MQQLFLALTVALFTPLARAEELAPVSPEEPDVGAQGDERGPEATARAEEASAPEASPDDAEPAPLSRAERRRARPYVWGGIGVPLVNYNTTDGFGFGVGGEVYSRRRGTDFGFRDRIQLSTFWTVTGRYTSNLLEYERRDRHRYFLRASYRLWSDMIYEGLGGDDVVVDKPDEVTLGNRLAGPSLQFTAQFSVPRVPVRPWVQLYTRYSAVDPADGGLLEADAPWGVDGGWYGDVSLGLSLDEVDRWPVPNRGVKAQASVRGGFSTHRGEAAAIVGTNVEITAWQPVVGRWLTLGGRALFDKTWGPRPFWESEWLGGLMRDELGYDQMLVGYGRTRTRGDGVLALLVDLRANFGRTRHPVIDIAFSFDVFAETAFLFDGDRLGPHLPTVGLGPGLLWQGATLLRPWVAFGWMSEEPGGPRRAVPQFGLALVEPM